MKIAEAKEEFRKLVADYFGDSHVFYAQTKMVKLPEPYITIQITGINRQVHESKLIEDSGYVDAYREIVASVDLNLYTKGRSIAGSSTVYANTSLDDLVGFMDYLESEAGIGKQDTAGIAIAVDSQPKDLSALIREAQFQYRAMASFTLRFTDMTYGDYYQNNNELPNASGGGNKEMITEPSYIETVEIAQDDSGQ